MLSGGADSPLAIFSVGAKATSGPNTLCTCVRTIETTLVVPPIGSLLTASAKAYLSSGVSNLIHKRCLPDFLSMASITRGTRSRLM